MKKIISLFLVVLCVFSMFSCAKDDGENNNDQSGNSENTVTALDKVNGIIDDSLATRIVTHVDYTYGGETFKGRYTTQIDRASDKSQFDFSYQRLAIPGEDVSDSHIKTIAGTVYYKNGEVSSNKGANWQTLGSGYLEFSLDFSENKLTSYEVSEDGNDITAKVSAENSMRVFGTEIAAEGDITVTVDTNGEYLYSVTISYTAKDTGATVVVNTTYDYSIVTLNF